MSRSSFLAPVPPSVAIEIARGRVCVTSISGGPGGAAVAAYATESLPDDAVVPALAGTNIREPKAVTSALKAALDRAGLRSTSRAALVVPDSIARLTLMPFDQVPARAADLDQLIRWQLKKATPFPMEQAQVSHFVAHADGGKQTLAVVVARQDVVREYEAVTDALGVHAGLVDLASLSVMNAVIGGGGSTPEDWLLVHLAAEATTMAILRGEQLMFYRHRVAVDQEPLAALVHQTAMYHEDRLGGSRFGRVWLSGAGMAGRDALARASDDIATRLEVDVEMVDVRPAAALGGRIDATPDVLDTLAAPVGVLLRERKAA